MTDDSVCESMRDGVTSSVIPAHAGIQKVHINTVANSGKGFSELDPRVSVKTIGE